MSPMSGTGCSTKPCTSSSRLSFHRMRPPTASAAALPPARIMARRSAGSGVTPPFSVTTFR